MRCMTILVTIAMLMLCYYKIKASQLRFKTDKKEATGKDWVAIQ